MKGFSALFTVLLVAAATVIPAVQAEVVTARNLLSLRNSDHSEERQLGIGKLFKKAGKDIKKAGKDLGKDIKKAGDGLIDDIGDGLADAVKDTKNALAKALGKKFIKRSKSFFNDLKSGSEDGWEKMLGGFDSIGDYFDNQFVDDLEWLGKEIAEAWDFWCDAPLAQAATVTVCSYALNAAVCIITSGAAPYCASAALVETLKKTVSQALLRTVLTCTVYRGLKEIDGDGWCNGRAMGVSEGIANFLVNDPFTPVCNIAVGCACGNCPWECDYPINPVCVGSSYKAALKEFTTAVAKIFD